MDKSIFEAFLLRTAIPKVTERKNIPDCIEGESDLLWDCIWRAHRDVLAGYRFVDEKFYRAFADRGGKKRVNKIAEQLYTSIQEQRENEKSLSSMGLIEELYKDYRYLDQAKDPAKEKATVFGAIQKLVNMTLKYMLILQSFGVQDNSLSGIKLGGCDCPLDSTILGFLGESDVKWTQLKEGDYRTIEEGIPEDKEWGRIAYDLRNWPAEDDTIRCHDR